MQPQVLRRLLSQAHNKHKDTETQRFGVYVISSTLWEVLKPWTELGEQRLLVLKIKLRYFLSTCAHQLNHRL